MPEKQKEEALLRLRQLVSMYGLSEEVITDFQDRNIIHCSSVTLAYADNLECVFNSVDEIREEMGIFPYYVILDPVFITVLYVGTYEEDWEKERPDYMENGIFAYVINIREPQYSEFGSVGIEGCDDAIIRVS